LNINYLNKTSVKIDHERLGDYYFYFQHPDYTLFTDNETNLNKTTGAHHDNPFVKDAFHDAVIHGTNRKKLHHRNFGTKFSPMYQLKIKGKKINN
jgi:hypothetical protein